MTAGLMALCYDSYSDVTRRGQGQEIPVSRERGRLLITSETRPDKKMEKRMGIVDAEVTKNQPFGLKHLHVTASLC